MHNINCSPQATESSKDSGEIDYFALKPKHDSNSDSGPIVATHCEVTTTNGKRKRPKKKIAKQTSNNIIDDWDETPKKKRNTHDISRNFK